MYLYVLASFKSVCMTVADLEIFKGGCKPPRAAKLPTLGGSGGMLPQENFVILMLLKWILKHLGHILVV